MVTANQTLQARAYARIAVILAQLDGLIDPPVPVTKVSRERRPQMNPKTFFGAGGALS